MSAAPSERALAWATLAQKGLPGRALAALLRELPDPVDVLSASRATLARIVPDTAVARLVAPVDPARDALTRAWLADPAHEVIAWDDPDFPQELLALGDAPPALFFVGRRELLNRPALAIVGSRSATPAGIENARAFAQALADAGLTIVSGLALGIDAGAHRGALEGRGSTIAVVGTGLDRVYPARNRALAHAIAAGGALLSEFPPGTPARKENFPRRNRLISGLARGVLVVEATLSSGSLITARLAGEQGREVFAIPGSIHSPFSKGCHKLIREGAKLVETAQDVLEELPQLGRRASATVRAPDSAGEPDALLEALGFDPVSLDALVARTGLAAAPLQARLLELELEGHVARLPGGLFQRVASA